MAAKDSLAKKLYCLLPVQEIEELVICHGIITNITDRVEAEQKLNKVNRLYLFIN
jgi:hypothetical protein